MSYSNETGTPNYIQFYWLKSALFDNISLRTLYRAKTIKNEAGESQVDDYAMTEDEEDAFLLFAQQAFYDAYDIVLKMTTGVTTDPLQFDDTIVLSSTSYPNAYGFKIKDEEAYNENNLLTVDDGIKKYIDAHIMTAWYELVGMDTEYAKWMAKLNDARIDLVTKKLFQLRKPLIG